MGINKNHNKEISSNVIIPPNVRAGDIIVARYKESKVGGNIPWEDWDHAAIVVKINPLTIVEAVGENNGGQPPGPVEILFSESIGFGKAGKNLVKMKWLQPIFPRTIRQYAKWYVPWVFREKIIESKAREFVVAYAIEQAKNKEPYNEFATKWDENEWYCSLLVYKSFSKTITGMYLEDYSKKFAGTHVTPEDLVDSKRTQVYFTWTRTDSLNEEK